MPTVEEKTTPTADNVAAPSVINTVAVDAISNIRVPRFVPERPQVWFAELESQFTLFGIKSEERKFHYASSHLDYAFAKEVDELILSPPKEEPYQKLKAMLVERLTKSSDARLRQLLEREEIGDRKPSQLH